MEIKEIKALIEALDQSSIAKLEFVQGDNMIILEKEKKESQVMVTQAVCPEPSQLAPTAPTDEAKSSTVGAKKDKKLTIDVLSPLVGVFYQASSPEADPFVKIGQVVNAGDTICILEAMKVLNEIKAPTSGTIVAIHADNGDVVEFNQLLMEIGD